MFGSSAKQDNVLLDQPGRLLPRWQKHPLWDRLAIRRHARRLLKELHLQSDHHITHIFHPAYWPYVEALGSKFVVYHKYDAFQTAPGWTNELSSHEDALVDRADLVITATTNAISPRHRKKPFLELTNGVNYEAFRNGYKKPCPEDLARVPYPRIGYTGNVTPKVDLGLIARLAAKRPDWNWVFVGIVALPKEAQDNLTARAKIELDTCRSLPNIYFLGDKAYSELPAYISHMDVNCMCYRFTKGWWNSGGYPLKLHEYLAAGKPIVSVQLAHLKNLANVLAMASNDNDWLTALEHALLDDGIGSVKERRSVARNHDWTLIVNRLEESLFSMLQTRNTVCN